MSKFALLCGTRLAAMKHSCNPSPLCTQLQPFTVGRSTITKLLTAEGAACAEQLASTQRSTAGSSRQGRRQPADLHARLTNLVRQLDRIYTQDWLTRMGAGAVQPYVELVRHELPLVRSLATALLEYWRRPEAAEAGQLELAQAAAARSCAYLRCANLECEGGPAAGEGTGAKRCRWVGLEGMGRFGLPMWCDCA